MISTNNPQAKPINQKRGPTTGNMNPGGKRGAFQAAKTKSGSEKSALANSIIEAIAARGRGQQPAHIPATEPAKNNVNVGRGPRKGNAAK